MIINLDVYLVKGELQGICFLGEVVESLMREGDRGVRRLNHKIYHLPPFSVPAAVRLGV
jgi:hypothetical protein